MLLEEMVFSLEGHKAPFPVGPRMFSYMNRIFGKWVDDTITPSDLHAAAPRLWRAQQICPHLRPNRIYPNGISYL